jgi:hypothetical protein
MAFNSANWGVISSSGNTQTKTLQSGAVLGAPGIYTYQSATETINTISATDYFIPVGPNLAVNDLIYIVASDISEWFHVLQVDISLGTVIIGQTVGLGDVTGPASATDNALVRFDGTTGKLIKNSIAILTNLGVLTGLTGLTSSGIKYPVADGTAGQVLGTDGAGNTAFINNAKGTWVNQTTSPKAVVANTEYIANTAGLLTFTMPATAAVGDIFEIAGNGAGGWLLQMNAGQTANLGNTPTTVAGSLASTNRYDCVSLVCTVVNTTFTVKTSMGNITVA